MTMTFEGSLTPSGIDSVIRDLETFYYGYLMPDVDAYACNLAYEAKQIMARDVHDETDNPMNSGQLKLNIESANLIKLATNTYGVSVSTSGDTEPLTERDWGDDRKHGETPPPHDYTRNVPDELKESAQIIWDESVDY